ncbi:MAG: hypothetical protein ACOYJI_06350 [Anaerovoracaceae bacterium]
MTGEATDKSLKTVLQMVLMIVESSETKEEAVEKLKSLELLRDDYKNERNSGRDDEGNVRALRGSNVISQPGRVGAQKKLPSEPHESKKAEQAEKARKNAAKSSEPIEQPGRVGAQKSLTDQAADGLQTLGDFIRSAADAAREVEKKAAEEESKKKADARREKSREAAVLRDKQKSEALRRMKALKLLPSIVDDFRKNGTVYMSGEEGMLYFPAQEQLDLVHRFEKANNVLVYHILDESKPYGRCCTMLYVPSDPSGWKSFDKNIRDGLVDAYVYNMTKPDMSEAGLIQVKAVNGGVERFDVMDFLFH